MIRLAAIAAGLLVSCCFAAGGVADEPDGPYVVRAAAGRLAAWSVDTAGEVPKKVAVPVAVGGKLTIPAVAHLPAFQVVLRAPAANSPDVVAEGTNAPLFVVADTHGEFEILAGTLMSHPR